MAKIEIRTLGGDYLQQTITAIGGRRRGGPKRGGDFRGDGRTRVLRLAGIFVSG